jgi:hypothetical protein
MRELSIIFIGLALCAFASNDNNTQNCQDLGKLLIKECVISVPDDKRCPSIYSVYLSCINLLQGGKRKLIYNINLDKYKGNSYSPCGYEISNLILADRADCGSN